MKFLILPLLLAASLIAAQEQPPACAANCLVAAASQLNCALTDTTCLCSNKFTAVVTPCVETHCSVREALTATNISASTCNLPSSSRRRILDIVPPICGAISTVVVVAKVAERCISKTHLKVEDYLVIVSWMLLVAGATIAVEMAGHGMGQNIWTIPQENIYYIFKLYYIDELLYITCLCFTKISVLLFFGGLFFPMKWFQIAVWISVTVMAMYNVAFVVVLAFQCVPVPGAWTAWDGTFKGKCINLNLVWWLAAGLNIAFDLGIMSLPFWPLRKLQMSLKKKIQIGLMLGVGFFVTVVSIVRLQSLIQFGSTTNPTYDDIPLAYWSTIEMCFSIVVSCMPSFRLFILRFFPRLDSVAGKSGAHSGYRASGGNGSGQRGHFTSSKKTTMQARETALMPDNNSAYELLESDMKVPKTFDPKPLRT